jgi:hypothetical protein
MQHLASELAAKLKEMYPEIEQHKLGLELEYKDSDAYWVIKLSKGDHRLHTLLNKSDADACLEGTQCVYLGVQIGQFVKNFEWYA